VHEGETLIIQDITKTEFNNCFIIHIAFSLINLSKNNDLSHKTTFCPQINITHNNSIKIIENSFTYQSSVIKLLMSKKSVFAPKKHSPKHRSFMFFFTVSFYSCQFKTAACYKITYRWLNLYITQFSASR
jgi:hypothetical protein